MNNKKSVYRRVVVDLTAVAMNYRQLSERISPAECGAVVKADAYGLGVIEIARTLLNEGCSRFFVATAEEAIKLISVVANANVYVLEGLDEWQAEQCSKLRIWPVLNTLDQAQNWAQASSKRDEHHCCIHVDTGMNRLGMSEGEFLALCGDKKLLKRLNVDFVMTHLACSDDKNHPQNREQLKQFGRLRELLPGIKTSVVSSTGVFLDKPYHGEIARPGICLYGANPQSQDKFRMQETVQLQGRIIQIRNVTRDCAVGYGATATVTKGARLATVAMGYADGYHRSLSGKAFAMVASHRVPLVGRVSMDYLVLDVSEVPVELVNPGDWATLLGGGIDIDELAALAGTISYELLTGIGRRVIREYRRT